MHCMEKCMNQYKLLLQQNCIIIKELFKEFNIYLFRPILKTTLFIYAGSRTASVNKKSCSGTPGFRLKHLSRATNRPQEGAISSQTAFDEVLLISECVLVQRKSVRKCLQFLCQYLLVFHLLFLFF